jgi:hypothetical protein
MANFAAKQVLGRALLDTDFREALRQDPRGAFEGIKDKLNVDDDPTDDELEALRDLSDDDFASLKKISEGLGDGQAMGAAQDVTGGVIL